MFSRFRQHPFLVAAFVGAVVLAAALPIDQFVELAKLAIQIGIHFAAACLVVFVVPGLICGDWFQGVARAVCAMRLAQGWHSAPRGIVFAAIPPSTSSILLPPPRSIS